MKNNILAAFCTVLTGMAATAQTATVLSVEDSRNTATTPATYSRSIQGAFKQSSVISAPAGAGFYTTILGVRGWADNSGGKAHELAFMDNHQLYIRSGLEPTWEAWRKILVEDQNGNIGIGTINPAFKLDVNAPQTRIASNSWGGISFEKQPYPNEGALLFSTDRSGYTFSIGNKRLSDGNVRPIITMYDWGNVGINTTTPAATLDVNGTVRVGAVNTPAGYGMYVANGILTEKVKVAVKTSADWADHVFAPHYKLMPLEQVARFIQNNRHLPGIPSAANMVKEGNDLGKTDAKLLEKIEELTLYVLELNRKIAAQQQEINTLKKAQ